MFDKWREVFLNFKFYFLSIVNYKVEGIVKICNIFYGVNF